MCHRHYQLFRRTGSTTPSRAYGKNEGGCSVDGCPRAAKTTGLCSLHYQRARKGQDLLAPVPQKIAVCSLGGCKEPHHAGGYCSTHYTRLQRTGDPGAVEKLRQSNTGKTCAGPECERPAVAVGYCPSHYYQHSRGLPLEPIRTFKPKGVPCEAAKCTRRSVSEGLCRTHYMRRLAGEVDWARPISKKAPDGDGHINTDGYRIITVDGRNVGEHRHLVEQLLGRSFDSEETVHHRNGGRADNRTDGPLRVVNGKLQSGNLELWSSSQPKGQEVPAKLDWAFELQARYVEFWTAEHWAAYDALAATRPR